LSVPFCDRHELEKFDPLQTRFFNFVKYTKTLSVRNQHDTESCAFFAVLRDATHRHTPNLLLRIVHHTLACALDRAENRAVRPERNRRTSKRTLFHQVFCKPRRHRLVPAR
jgi:hypothetical protein